MAAVKKIFKIIFWILIVALIALRIALPYIIKAQANKKLASLPDYKGHLDDVDLSVIRGRVAFQAIHIKHRAGDYALYIDQFGVNVRWLDLLRGVVVVDTLIERPVVRI